LFGHLDEETGVANGVVYFFVAAMAVCVAMVPLSADDAPQQIDETNDEDDVDQGSSR
jgi:hypothetical protein